MGYVEDFNACLGKRDYYGALKVLLEADDAGRERILGHIGVDGVYSLFVNALVENHADLNELLDMVRELGRQYFDPIYNDLESIVKTYIARLLEDMDFDNLRRLADDLGELPVEEYGWSPKLYAWARLLSNQSASQLWLRLQDDVDNKKWVDAVNVYAEARDKGLLRIINDVLKREGIDPDSFWKGIVFNAVVEAVDKGDPEKARKILVEYGDILDEKDWVSLAGYVYTSLAHSCGEKGDTECIDKLLSKAPREYREAVLLSWITPILKSPDKYSREVLEKLRELADRYGYRDIYRYIDFVLNPDKYGEEIFEGVKDAIRELGEKVSSEVMDAIESGDTEKIRGVLEKYPNLLRNTVLKDNITLYDYLEAIAWFIEHQGDLRRVFDWVDELEDIINKYVDRKQEDPSITLTIDPSDIESLRNSLLNLVNTKEFYTLLHLGVLGEKMDKAIADTLGFLYFAEALALLDRDEKDKARVLASKASEYNPEYESTFYYLELIGTDLTDDDIECILESEGILAKAELRGEKPKPPSYRSRPVSPAKPAKKSFGGIPRPGTGTGVGERVPIPI